MPSFALRRSSVELPPHPPVPRCSFDIRDSPFNLRNVLLLNHLSNALGPHLPESVRVCFVHVHHPGK